MLLMQAKKLLTLLKDRGVNLCALSSEGPAARELHLLLPYPQSVPQACMLYPAT